MVRNMGDQVTSYQDDWLTVYLGDCREVMAGMEPESVHTVVTSPPYWGLRDYGTATWVGGDEACDHISGPARKQYRDLCGKCGARRIDSQLGLESTPEAYVESMVAVFREVRRVLRSDGTVWLNLGDSYVSGGAGSWGSSDKSTLTTGSRNGAWAPGKTVGKTPPRELAGLKPKDLVGIPWRVAFALQADGWYLRSDIIWAKPNPMPESVTDRPTKAHEYLFLLSKSPRYYYDADAVREPNSNPDLAEQPHDWRNRPGNGEWPSGTGGRMGSVTSGRNLRSVWTIATQPYPGAHFATFPQALVEPCIKAGTSEKGVCPECGAPWERVEERMHDTASYSTPDSVSRTPPGKKAHRALGRSYRTAMAAHPPKTTGWQPTCIHQDPHGTYQPSLAPVPATVLDPFAGSGTTGLVAQRLSRRAVLIDLNADYLGQVMERNRDIPLGLSTPEEAA
jgi:DNA modification methylase